MRRRTGAWGGLHREVLAQRVAAVRQAIRDMSNGQAIVMAMTDTAVSLCRDMRDRADAVEAVFFGGLGSRPDAAGHGRIPCIRLPAAT